MIPKRFETPKEPGLFPGDSPELFSGSIIASVQSAKEINMSSCGFERQLLRHVGLVPGDYYHTIANNPERFDTRVLRHLFRTSESGRVQQRGKGKNHNGRREIDDLESELSSRIDEHAVDEHYATRRPSEIDKGGNASPYRRATTRRVALRMEKARSLFLCFFFLLFSLFEKVSKSERGPGSRSRRFA